MPDLDQIKQGEQGYALKVGLLACQIDVGELIRHVDRDTERAAAVEQRGEAFASAGSPSHRAEFDKAAALAGLACRQQ